MNPIVFPLEPGSGSPAVGDLQAALLQLLSRNAILQDDFLQQRELSRALRGEAAEQKYGDVTKEVVQIFQEEQGLRRPSGTIDEPTAKALNALLEEFGLLDQPGIATTRGISGAVIREDELPLAGVTVIATHEARGQNAVKLGRDITDSQGRYTIRYQPLPSVGIYSLRVTALDPNGNPLQFSDLIQSAEALVSMDDLIIPIAKQPDAAQRIEGTILLAQGVPATGLKLRLYQRGFGGTSTLLSETSTLAGGQYAFTYAPDGKQLSLEVRAVNAANEETPLSKPLNQRTRPSRSQLNLVAPGSLAAAPTAEYSRLSAELTPHVGQMVNLVEVKENDEQQDLTVLNRATGWDARLIALAAKTERLHAEINAALSKEVLYGLLRAGLPSEKLLLAQVDAETAAETLTAVRDAKIVELSDAEIDTFKAAFTTFRTTERLTIAAPGSRSTYNDFVASSGLPAAEQTVVQSTFAPLFLDHRGSDAELWQAAADAGISPTAINTLQRHGKFAFLAGNSHAMVGRLMAKEIDDPVMLVDAELHRAEAWRIEILEQAGLPTDLDTFTDAQLANLNPLIPTTYEAEEGADRLDAYAADMARKVRLSYPAQVIGNLMETDERFKLAESHDDTVTVLKRAAQGGFRLGETPVATFLQSHTEVTQGLDAPAQQAAQQQLETLQRIYQITPNNDAMGVMMDLDITSAYELGAYTQDEFANIYTDKYEKLYGKKPPKEDPQLVWAKARQVNSVTYNLFAVAKKMQNEVSIAGLSAPIAVREKVQDELIKQFPTIESLFGSLDFCECEHCQSVLSPAAYLVDLLQFIDAEPTDPKSEDAASETVFPYDVLIQRRPDLPHIGLTCENTQTALPYIDIVNEIMEYYVANDQLTTNAAYDTGSATTAELLAEPQNVLSQAYKKLRQATYPLNLPFDRDIATVRQFCSYLGVPLPEILEAFRQTDALFAPTPASFGRAEIFMESLGLSPAEVTIFTDAEPLANWHELYGFLSADQATTVSTDPLSGQRIDLNSAKTLSRRLGVTYQEISQLMQTEFVNPELTKLALLYKLDVSIADARLYVDQQAFYVANRDLIGADRATLSEADQLRFDALSEIVPDTNQTGWAVVKEIAAFEMRLDALAVPFEVTPEALQTIIQNISFDKTLVLFDPDASCNFDLTTLQYADGSAAKPIDFLRINLLVRLWRKLGWSLDETDRALTAFIPQSAPYDENPDNLAKQPLQTALIYMAHLKQLDETLSLGKQSRTKLLLLWADIGTTGQNSLYAQHFLTASILKSDPVFDHPLGQYLLAETNLKLRDHLLPVQGALGLTADEIIQILTDDGKNLDDTPAPDGAMLSLPTLSLLYRYRLLADGLKLSIQDLITIKELVGLNPFTPLHADPFIRDTLSADIANDHPFSKTLRFVEIVETVKESGLTIEDLDYLLRHRFDETGPYRPNPEATAALLETLAEGLRTIKTEHPLLDDPNTLTNEVLRLKLGLLLPADIAEQFIAMMNGTVDFTAVKDGVATADQLDPEIFANAPMIRDVSYDETSSKQVLSVRGVLLEPQKNDILALLPSSTVLKDLLEDIQQQAKTFFETHVQKQPADAESTSGFLKAEDFDFLFALGGIDQGKRAKLAETLLPVLQQRLNQQFIIQTMTAYTNAEPELVASLLTDERLLVGADSAALWTSLMAIDDQDEAKRAILLLTKAVQLIQILGLTVREIRYMVTNASDFGMINLNELPTEFGSNATTLFAKIHRLMNYARLKRNFPGNTDDIIDIFEASAAADSDATIARIASLTRRDVPAVEATIEALFDASSLKNEESLTRVWDVLQIVQLVGVQVTTIQAWLSIVQADIPSVDSTEERAQIASDLKETVKARFDPETWQRVAQPIFDRLRQQQRDALVSYMMHQKNFERLEQLYEYFLIDPGMEPVVQTSRIRLAISSLQLFIQRCLLNLEIDIKPSAINARHWEWMKRYRVWEANRKIFLFPENWLEPEFRADKTHLFTELEGALLQGDVSSDLVEDAFLNYLQQLDELARLDIVAMHLDTESEPGQSKLHVFGRTFGQPHKYFYRCYFRRMWTHWVPVGTEIEGDHLAPVVWRDRLYLFWVTFMDQPIQDASQAPIIGDDDIVFSEQEKAIDVQLHWSEYLGGEWSTRKSSEFLRVEKSGDDPLTGQGGVGTGNQVARSNGPAVFLGNETDSNDAGSKTVYIDNRSLRVPINFERQNISIFVSKSFYTDGREGGVHIHLDDRNTFRFNFYLAGRNSTVIGSAIKRPKVPANPYIGDSSTNATRYRYNDSNLSVDRLDHNSSEILTSERDYTLLPCNNTLSQLAISQITPQDSSGSGAEQLVTNASLSRISSLIKPVFIQYGQDTFFVEPSVTERTIIDWTGWVTPTLPSDPGWWKDTKKNVFVGHIAQTQDTKNAITPSSLIALEPKEDWLINENTVMEFDGVLIGPAGQPGLQLSPDGVGGSETNGQPISVNPGSGLGTGGSVILTDAALFNDSGLTQASSGLNVVGNAGFNSTLAQYLNPKRDAR